MPGKERVFLRQSKTIFQRASGKLTLPEGGKSLVQVRDVMGHTDIQTLIGCTLAEKDEGRAIALGVDLRYTGGVHLYQKHGKNWQGDYESCGTVSVKLFV